MDSILQWCAGGFYLLNKVFLSFSERTRKKGKNARARFWRIASWAIYILGLPPWVVIFINERNWIAASVEASGLPAMVLGLVNAIYGLSKKRPLWLDVFAAASALFGLIYSFYDFGGITSINQWLEIGLVAGFLIGTYLLAHEWASGYACYMVMHLCCGWLMWIEGYQFLFWQQVVSLVFIVDAFRVNRRKPKT